MTNLVGKVVAVYLGPEGVFGTEAQDSIQVEMDGVVGDRHFGRTRTTWDGGDKQDGGTVRRNERQWSATSIEELAEINAEMGVDAPLTAHELGNNLLLEGIPELCRLPMGTTLRFPSGAELMVEEYNPPCIDMAQELCEKHTVNGEPLESGAFGRAAKHKRGIIGVVEVAGEIRAGDEVVVKPYQPPKWQRR